MTKKTEKTFTIPPTYGLIPLFLKAYLSVTILHIQLNLIIFSDLNIYIAALDVFVDDTDIIEEVIACTSNFNRQESLIQL